MKKTLLGVLLWIATLLWLWSLVAYAWRPNPIAFQERQLLSQVYPLIDELYSKAKTSSNHEKQFQQIQVFLQKLYLNNDFQSTNKLESKRSRYAYDIRTYMTFTMRGQEQYAKQDSIMERVDFIREKNKYENNYLKGIQFKKTSPIEWKMSNFVDTHIYVIIDWVRVHHWMFNDNLIWGDFYKLDANSLQHVWEWTIEWAVVEFTNAYWEKIWETYEDNI